MSQDKAYEDVKKRMKEMSKKLYDTLNDSLIWGQGTVHMLPMTTNDKGGIWSGLLKKYIDPKTGEPMEEET